MAHKAMLAVKERGRQLAARIDSAAVDRTRHPLDWMRPGDEVEAYMTVSQFKGGIEGEELTKYKILEVNGNARENVYVEIVGDPVVGRGGGSPDRLVGDRFWISIPGKEYNNVSGIQLRQQELAAGTFKPGDKVYHVHGHVESGELIVVGPDPQQKGRINVTKEIAREGRDPISTTYSMKPTDLVPVDSVTGALITDMEKRRVKLKAEHEEAAAKRNLLWGGWSDDETSILNRWRAGAPHGTKPKRGENGHLLVPNELIGKKRTRRGEGTFRELNKSWTDLVAGSSDDHIDLTFTDTPPEIEQQSRYSDRAYRVVGGGR